MELLDMHVLMFGRGHRSFTALYGTSSRSGADANSWRALNKYLVCSSCVYLANSNPGFKI